MPKSADRIDGAIFMGGGSFVPRASYTVARGRIKEAVAAGDQDARRSRAAVKPSVP
jgi:hypothetical protein